MIKRSIQEENICKYSLNIGAPESLMKIVTDLKEEIDNFRVIVGDFSAPLHQ